MSLEGPSMIPLFVQPVDPTSYQNEYIGNVIGIY